MSYAKDNSTAIMNTYDFESTDFALSMQGVHLLRNRFNYQTIKYKDINKATIKRTREIKNVILSMTFGIILLAFAILQTLLVINIFNDPNVRKIYIESIILPLLPGLVGIYLIYIANKKGLMLIVETGRKSQKLRLRDFVKNKKAYQLRNYLNARLSNRLVVLASDLDV